MIGSLHFGCPRDPAGQPSDSLQSTSLSLDQHSDMTQGIPEEIFMQENRIIKITYGKPVNMTRQLGLFPTVIRQVCR